MLEKVLRGPHGVRSGWRLLIFIILTAILLTVVQLLVRLTGFRPNLAHGLTTFPVMVSDGIMFLCPLLVAWIMSRFERKTLGDYGLPGRGAFGRKFWVGAGIGYVAMTGLLVAIRLFHGFYFGSLAIGARGIFYFGIIWAVAFLIVGFAEEFLFRGYVLSTLAEGIGFWPAAIALSMLFGAAHLTNRGEDIVGALSIVAVGLLFCFSLRRSGSLWFAIGLHAAWDYSESFIYSVRDSGTMARGHLLNSFFPASAPTWLTGGSVGPEGSLFVFAILGILFLVVHWLYPEAQFPARRTVSEVSPPPESDAILG